jgi:hypothetical protein
MRTLKWRWRGPSFSTTSLPHKKVGGAEFYKYDSKLFQKMQVQLDEGGPTVPT